MKQSEQAEKMEATIERTKTDTTPALMVDPETKEPFIDCDANIVNEEKTLPVYKLTFISYTELPGYVKNDDGVYTQEVTYPDWNLTIRQYEEITIIAMKMLAVLNPSIDTKTFAVEDFNISNMVDNPEVERAVIDYCYEIVRTTFNLTRERAENISSTDAFNIAWTVLNNEIDAVKTTISRLLRRLPQQNEKPIGE